MPKHSETRELPYTAQQMFDLVADVARYPEFLPWCEAARVRSRTPEGETEVLLADLVIGFKVFRERFGSQAVLNPKAQTIEIRYLDGPFKYLVSKWSFEDLEAGRCRVAFHVDFEFRNRILQGAAGLFFNEAMQRIVRAFEDRARALHG